MQINTNCNGNYKWEISDSYFEKFMKINRLLNVFPFLQKHIEQVRKIALLIQECHKQAYYNFEYIYEQIFNESSNIPKYATDKELSFDLHTIFLHIALNYKYENFIIVPGLFYIHNYPFVNSINLKMDNSQILFIQLMILYALGSILNRNCVGFLRKFLYSEDLQKKKEFDGVYALHLLEVEVLKLICYSLHHKITLETLERILTYIICESILFTTENFYATTYEQPYKCIKLKSRRRFFLANFLFHADDAFNKIFMLAKNEDMPNVTFDIYCKQKFDNAFLKTFAKKSKESTVIKYTLPYLSELSVFLSKVNACEERNRKKIEIIFSIALINPPVDDFLIFEDVPSTIQNNIINGAKLIIINLNHQIAYNCLLSVDAINCMLLASFTRIVLSCAIDPTIECL
ncbi:hypothetical protein COBT_002295 [Conglomerata obtusa]